MIGRKVNEEDNNMNFHFHNNKPGVSSPTHTLLARKAGMPSVPANLPTPNMLPKDSVLFEPPMTSQIKPGGQIGAGLK